MKTLLFVSLFLLTLQSCTSDAGFQTGKDQLENQGYTDVQNTGYSAFCCDEKDTFSDGFSCKSKNGKVVTGCICSGLMKGVTIRFE